MNATTYFKGTLLWAYPSKRSSPDRPSGSFQRVWKPELNEGFEECLILWHIAGTRAALFQLHASRQANVGCEAPLVAIRAPLDLARVSSVQGLAVVSFMSVVVFRETTSSKGHVPDRDNGVYSVRSL